MAATDNSNDDDGGDAGHLLEIRSEVFHEGQGRSGVEKWRVPEGYSALRGQLENGSCHEHSRLLVRNPILGTTM